VQLALMSASDLCKIVLAVVVCHFPVCGLTFLPLCFYSYLFFFCDDMREPSSTHNEATQTPQTKIPILWKARNTHVQPASFSVQLLMPLQHANIAVFCAKRCPKKQQCSAAKLGVAARKEQRQAQRECCSQVTIFIIGYVQQHASYMPKKLVQELEHTSLLPRLRGMLWLQVLPQAQAQASHVFQVCDVCACMRACAICATKVMELAWRVGWCVRVRAYFFRGVLVRMMGVGMESWVVCACARVFFSRRTRAHEVWFLLICLACCGQQIPTLLMVLHHVLVCVCVL